MNRFYFYEISIANKISENEYKIFKIVRKDEFKEAISYAREMVNVLGDKGAVLFMKKNKLGAVISSMPMGVDISIDDIEEENIVFHLKKYER